MKNLLLFIHSSIIDIDAMCLPVVPSICETVTTHPEQQEPRSPVPKTPNLGMKMS